MEDSTKTLSRFRGCLLGLAIGDALGMPVEGARASSIRQRLGEVRDFLPAPWRRLEAGQWTDGTHMALCLARSIAEKGTIDIEDIAKRLLQWMSSGDWRGMSDAIYSSLRRIQEGADPRFSGEESAAASDSGSILRTVPLAMFRCHDQETLLRDTEAVCIITHRHPEALAGSKATALIISRAVRDELDPSAISEELASLVDSAALSERLSLLGRLLDRGVDETEALLRLGTGGHAAETVCGSLFCFLRHPRDFESALVTAVSGGLHADETAALTGAICGAFLGDEAIPSRWTAAVERAEEIKWLAERLHALAFNESSS